MNIVYIINQLRRSGPVIVLYDIIRNLDRARFTPIIARLMEDDPDRTMTQAFIAMGVEVIPLQYSFYDLELKTAKVAHSLDQLLASRRVGIIHTHGYHPVLVASHMELKCPKIETLHCVCNENFVDSKGILLGTYMSQRYLRRSVPSAGEKILCLSSKRSGAFSLIRIPVAILGWYFLGKALCFHDAVPSPRAILRLN